MLKAAIAQVLSMAAQPHDLPCCTMEVANRVWSGRVRVLEETNNEATERKQSKARDARAAEAGAAGAAARAGKIGVTQREGERERWMDGGSEISRTSARSHSALQLPGCSRPEDGEVLYLERSLLHNTWTDAQQPRGEG